MKSKLFYCVVACLGLWAVSAPAAEAPKLEFPAPSPACTIKQRVGLTDIEIVYSRPGVKDRQIFGGLVPYGEVWRTGANSATKVTFSTAVKLNGVDIAAGTYGLFTIPAEQEWTIIINKGAQQWGAYQYDEKADVVRFKSTPAELGWSMETFTIDWNDIRDESATLNLLWEKTLVPIKLKVEVTSVLLPQIDAVMSGTDPKKPYYQAAMFYFDHGQDLEKAAKWVDAAIAEREAHYMVHLKAKILAKQGKKDAAVAAANRSKELAITAKDKGYVKLNDDLIASLKQ